MLEPFRPLCAMLPKINAYRKHFDETKYMLFFLIKNDELIEKYNEIWNKVSKVIKKGFDSQLAYNNKYIKAKLKSYEVKINTNFNDDKDFI